MKAKYAYLFLTCFLSFSLTLFADASLLKNDGGEDVMIVASKTGDIICLFDIPKQYLDEGGKFILPINVSIYQSGKKAIYSESSFDLEPVSLPEITGTYTIIIMIGSYQAAYVYEK